MPEWTFVTNHAVLLCLMAPNLRISAREMTRRIGITERAVGKITKDLVDAGYLSKVREGRGATASTTGGRCGNGPSATRPSAICEAPRAESAVRQVPS